MLKTRKTAHELPSNCMQQNKGELHVLENTQKELHKGTQW
jgi:hypothetical protein